jgi:hypothetical protein
VYFVSHGGQAFPSLVVVLQGAGVRVDLVGDTFIDKTGITSSTFETIPDVPVESFELYLPQGPGSALAANGDLCKPTATVTVPKRVAVRRNGRLVHVSKRVKRMVAAPLLMPTEFTAQNGAHIHQNTVIGVTGCTAKAKDARTAAAHTHTNTDTTAPPPHPA